MLAGTASRCRGRHGDGRRRAGHAGLLHAFLRRAGRRRHRGRLRVRRAVQRRGRARQRVGACSSIRRSPARPASRSCSNWPDCRAVAPEARRRMLSKRIIACLDVRDGKVVKGVNFEGLRDAGDPAGARAPLQRRRHRRDRDPRRDRHGRGAAGARAHHCRGRARDLPAARRRRRHPQRRRCGGGDRGRRRQGEPQHGGARATRS